MANQKSAPSANSAVRDKAKAMRLEQERADARIRNIIIGVVAAVVLVVTAAVVYVVATAEKLGPGSTQPGSVVTNPEQVAELLGDYKDGSPIVISHKGFGVADESLPTITEYFDYSCPGCGQVSHFFGDAFIKGAKEGKYNAALQPVSTHAAPWHFVASGASIIVANKAPEQWEAFHKELMDYMFTETVDGRADQFNNASKSYEKIKSIALGVGVPQEVVDAIPAEIATEYLDKSSQAWGSLTVEGREKPVTPEFVVDGKKKIQLPSVEPAEAMKALEDALAK